jgi:hypothetical protein
MGVQTPEPAEAPFGHSLPLQVGEHDLPRVADTDPLHFSFAVDEDTNLAPDLARQLGELARELLRHEVVGRETPLVQLFEPMAIAGLEPDDVSFDPMNELGSWCLVGYLLLVCDASRSSFARAER